MTKKYVVSLELAKKLKGAGCVQESEWYWCEPFISDENGVMPTESALYPNDEIIMQNTKKIASAFHVGELGEMLPEKIEGYQAIDMGKYQGKNVVRYLKIGNSLSGIRFDEDTEAECRGKMLLYLKKEGLI